MRERNERMETIELVVFVSAIVIAGYDVASSPEFGLLTTLWCGMMVWLWSRD